MSRCQKNDRHAKGSHQTDELGGRPNQTKGRAVEEFSGTEKFGKGSYEKQSKRDTSQQIYKTQ